MNAGPLESTISQEEKLKKRRFALESEEQEEKLKKCRFALESEEQEEEHSSPQLTGIVMVSIPESNVECLEDDVFHTPPEQYRSQSMLNSQVGNDTFTEPENGVMNVVVDSDLGDSDNVVFSGTNAGKVNGVGCVGESDLSKSDMERTVDLGKDFDTLVSSELSVIKGIDGVKDVVRDPDLSKGECGLKECQVLESGCNVCAESMEFTETIVMESENVSIEVTEVVSLAFEHSCEEMGVRVSENTENVGERAEGANSGGDSADKKIEHFDAFECASGEGVPVRRGLPDLYEEPKEDEGLSVPQRALNDVKTFMDLLEAAMMFIGDSNIGTDYLKAAKENGLTFYRPRWWPSEGFDDELI